MLRKDRQFTFTERILSIATSIRPGEGKSAIILTFQAFLTLISYTLINPVKDALILAEQGAEIRNYVTGAQTLVLLVIIPLYSRWVKKHSGSRMIQKLNFFFASNLVLFYFALISGFQIGIAFYMWMAIFSVMVLAQFWAFTTDLYNVKSGQRLIVAIMLGASLGGLVGAKAAMVLFPIINVEGLVLLSAFVLLVTLPLSNRVKKYIPEQSKCHSSDNFVDDANLPSSTQSAKPNVMGGFSVVAKDVYLIAIATFMVLLNWISTNGDYILGEFVLNWADQMVSEGVYDSVVTATGSFYANYIFWVNVISLFLQTFLVSRLFKWIGIKGTILILPVVLIITYGLIFIIPIFSLMRLAKIAEKGVNLSVTNTTRQALFLPTSREAKYEGKMAIETFFWRFGDLFSVATVFITIHYFNFSITQFIAVNLIISIFMLLVAIKIGHYHREKMLKNMKNEPPIVTEEINNLTIIPGERFTYIIPKETFIDPDLGDALKYKALTSEGKSLPRWLRFISLECCFVGKPPTNLLHDFELEIHIIATDYDGLSVNSSFIIKR